jgi:hypothetical protein
VPAAATLEVAGAVTDGGAWAMAWDVGERSGGRFTDAGRGKWHRAISVPDAPASVSLSVETGGGTARLDTLAMKLKDGKVLDLLPSTEDASPEETIEEGLARAELRLRALAATGIRSVALYGAGEHSRRLMALLAGGPCKVVAVIDDGATDFYFHGVRLVTPADWPSLDADALVVSSRGSEAALAGKARGWLPSYVPIICFYTAEGRR